MGKDLKGKDLGKGYSQRKDGRYEARAVINGVKIDIYDMNLSSLKKAFEVAKAIVLRDEKNVRPNVTLKEWYTEWFEKCKAPTLKSDVSRKTYDRKARNTYIAVIGNKRMEDITQINMQEATKELVDKGYTERTIKEALGVIRECMDIAIVNHIIRANPCTGIKVLDANTQKERRVLSHDEQRQFLNEVKNSYYYEAYAILLSTGMRIGEFSGLQWNDVDFENKQIKINRSMQTAYLDGKKIEELTTPKTSNSYRTIPFFGDTEQLFRAWKIKQDFYKQKLGDRWRARPELGDLVFTSTMGSPVTRYVIVHDINKVVQNMNLKEIYAASREGRQPKEFAHLHPHAFRHTFATRCFEKGLDPLFVQSIMGHANYSTTVSYTHILDDMKQKEVAKVGSFLD
jgi:integrase